VPKPLGVNLLVASGMPLFGGPLAWSQARIIGSVRNCILIWWHLLAESSKFLKILKTVNEPYSLDLIYQLK
jgi:hypothetical protein